MSEVWDGWCPSMARCYVAHRAPGPIEIDGRLDKLAWRDVPWTQDFVDIQGDGRPRPRFRTRAKMCWDARYLYVAAEMEEPHVWATLTQRDSVIFQDNDFEVFIDPDGDHCDYYELEINALNTVWDLRLPRPYRDGGTPVNGWDIAGLKTAVRVDGTLNDASDVDRGWSVEMALPWEALGEFSRSRSPPLDGEQWRINFSRVQWQARVVEGRYEKMPGLAEDNWVWSPQGVIDMHRPERWGYVQFSSSPPGTEVAFSADTLSTAKWYLQRVHEAQKAYRERTGAWASDAAELHVSAPAGFDAIAISTTPHAYAAVMRVQGATLRKDSSGALRIE